MDFIVCVDFLITNKFLGVLKIINSFSEKLFNFFTFIFNLYDIYTIWKNLRSGLFYTPSFCVQKLSKQLIYSNFNNNNNNYVTNNNFV